MSQPSLFLTGAAVGLALAIVGNLFVLPFVLRMQETRLSDDWTSPVFGLTKPILARWTKLAYRLFLPAFFMLIGGKIAIDFGSPS